MAKKDKADIWMPWYIGDYLADTMRLTTEQHGAYLLLLAEHWMRGPIPDDDDTLAAITRLPIERWQKTRGLFLGFFSVIDGFWINNRCQKEKAKAEAFKAKQKANGSKGGRPKNPNETQMKPNDEPKQNPNESPSPSPSPSKGINKSAPKADAFGVLQILETFPTLSESLARDFIEHRKAKRAKLTQSAWDGIAREIIASGMTPDAALRETMARGWTGFKADWVQGKPQRLSGRHQEELTWCPDDLRGTADDPLFNQGSVFDAIQ